MTGEAVTFASSAKAMPYTNGTVTKGSTGGHCVNRLLTRKLYSEV